MVGFLRFLFGKWQHTVLLAVILLLFVLEGIAASRYLLAEYHLRQAQEALHHWDFATARTHLDECLEMRPGDASLHLLAARTARRGGFFDEAEKHLWKCQSLEGISPVNTLEWVLLCAHRGQLTPEIESYLIDRLVHDDPETSLILEALAFGYNHIYNLNGAQECLKRLCQRKPNNAFALMWYGRLLETTWAYSKAVEAFQRAVDSAPDYVDARRALAGALLQDVRNSTAAAEQFEWLRQRWPDDPEALLGLALCRSELGETEQAVELFDTLLRAHPEDCRALTKRGKLELQRNHPQEAEEYLQRSLAQGGPEREALFLLNQAQTHQGKRKAAQKTQVALEKLETDMKQMEAALRLVSKAPRDPGPRLELARICVRNGQEQEALRWLLGTLQIAPDHQPTHQALAECYERIGQPEQAELHRHFLSPSPDSKAEAENKRTGPSPKH